MILMDLQALIKILSDYSTFYISTHKYCDGDGLGAGLALCYGLKKQNKQAQFITLEEPHQKYQFLNQEKAIQVFDYQKDTFDKNAVLLVVDTNDPELVQPLYSSFKKTGQKIIFIDHHPVIHNKKEDEFFIDTKASSTAEIVHTLFQKIKIPLDEQMATALFTSIVFDTNQFRAVKNSPAPFEMAGQLIPHIKNLDTIYNSLFKTLTVEKLNFFNVIQNIEYFHNKTLAFLFLTEKDLQKYKTDINQAYDLMDMVKDIDSIQATALVVQNKDGSCKLSLRSQNRDLLPLVSQFQGGGHPHSAGAYVKGKSLEDIKKTIVNYFK